MGITRSDCQFSSQINGVDDGDMTVVAGAISVVVGNTVEIISEVDVELDDALQAVRTSTMHKRAIRVETSLDS